MLLLLPGAVLSCKVILLKLLLLMGDMSLLRGEQLIGCEENSLTVVTSPEFILERGFFSRVILAFSWWLLF